MDSSVDVPATFTLMPSSLTNKDISYSFVGFYYEAEKRADAVNNVF